VTSDGSPANDQRASDKETNWRMGGMTDQGDGSGEDGRREDGRGG
jgi:hypothetical protein